MVLCEAVSFMIPWKLHGCLSLQRYYLMIHLKLSYPFSASFLNVHIVFGVELLLGMEPDAIALPSNNYSRSINSLYIDVSR